MRLPACVACKLPVLQLIGQFEKLDSYYLEDGGPPRETAGFWHTRCLIESPHGPPWYAARLRNHVEVRRFERIAEVGTWTVVRDSRSRAHLAFSHGGELLHLDGARGKARKVEGGAVFPIVNEYNLELDDPDLIATIQHALVTNGTFPIPELITRMGIAERVHRPIALERAVFRFERSLRRHWQSNFVSAQAEYGRFVPHELEPYFARAR